MGAAIVQRLADGIPDVTHYARTPTLQNVPPSNGRPRLDCDLVGRGSWSCAMNSDVGLHDAAPPRRCSPSVARELRSVPAPVAPGP